MAFRKFPNMHIYNDLVVGNSIALPLFSNNGITPLGVDNSGQLIDISNNFPIEYATISSLGGSGNSYVGVDNSGHLFNAPMPEVPFYASIQNVSQNPATTTVTVTIGNSGLSTLHHESIYIERGSVRTFSDQTPMLSSPTYNPSSPLGFATFTGFTLQDNDTIVYAIYDGPNTTLANISTLNAKKYRVVSFIYNGSVVPYSVMTGEYSYSFVVIQYNAYRIMTGSDATTFIHSTYSSEFMISALGNFGAIFDAYLDTSAYTNLVVYKTTDLILKVTAESQQTIYTGRVITANYSVAWGDGSVTSYNQNSYSTHIYSSAGDYYVGISGSSPIQFTWECQGYDPFTIEYWGSNSLLDNSLNGAYITEVNASDAPTFIGTSLYYMFANCSYLTALNIDSWDTSMITDMSYMFYNCGDNIYPPVAVIDLTTFNTGNVTNMTAMFKYNGFHTINCSGWNTSNVISMGISDPNGNSNGNSMFYNCNLFELYLSGWTINCLISGLFKYNYYMKTIDVSGWTINSSSLAQTFYGMYSLESLNTTGWDMGNVESMFYMFEGENQLQEIVGVENWDTRNVVNMEGVFEYCTLLQSLDLSRWNTSKCKTIREMFEHCEALSSLNMTGWDVTNIASIQSTFQQCYVLDPDISGWEIPYINIDDFESGNLSGNVNGNAWIIDSISSPPPAISSTQVHSGTYSLKLDGEQPTIGNTTYTSIYKQITLPSGISSGKQSLSFWYYPYAEGNIDTNWQDAYITTANGVVNLATALHTCNNSQTWINTQLELSPLSAYAGQTVGVKFLVHDGLYNTNIGMYIDDIQIITTKLPLGHPYGVPGYTGTNMLSYTLYDCAITTPNYDTFLNKIYEMVLLSDYPDPNGVYLHYQYQQNINSTYTNQISGNSHVALTNTYNWLIQDLGAV